MTRIAVALALVLAAFTLAGPARGAETTTGQCSIDRIDSSPARVQLEFRTESQNGESHWDSSHDADLARVGLTATDLDSEGRHVQFTVTHEAGSFVCDGWAGHGHASGSFTFTPSATFVLGLQKRGFTDVPPENVLSSASLDLTLAYIDGVSEAGYAHMKYSRYITFRALSISPESISGLRKTFGNDLEAEQVVSLTALRVTPEYVEDMRSLGVTPLTARQAVELRALHIDRAYIEGLAKLGYSHLASRELVEMKALAIDADYIRHLADHGMKNLTVSQLVRMKSVGI